MSKNCLRGRADVTITSSVSTVHDSVLQVDTIMYACLKLLSEALSTGLSEREFDLGWAPRLSMDLIRRLPGTIYEGPFRLTEIYCFYSRDMVFVASGSHAAS